LGLVTGLGGCTLSERAETVYLQQHRASTALTETIVFVEEADPKLADSLYETESALDDACAPLREASYRKLGGETIDSDLEWAIVDSLDGCAAETQEVERLLWRIDPETARFFLGTPDLASAAQSN
jgi:hypothetical protein